MRNKPLILIGLVLLLLCTACQPETGKTPFTPTAEPTETTVVPTAAPTATPVTNCTEQNPHPMGLSISEQFQISYEQVMTWYCQGDAFSDILLALETQEIADEVEAEELLSRLETQTWEEIWEDLGVSPGE